MNSGFLTVLRREFEKNKTSYTTFFYPKNLDTFCAFLFSRIFDDDAIVRSTDSSYIKRKNMKKKSFRKERAGLEEQILLYRKAKQKME